MDDLLEQVLACFREEVSGVEFRRGSASGWGTRLLTVPVVSGEVLSQRQEGDSRETVLQFSLFSVEREQGEELLSTLWSLLAEHFPGCTCLERGDGAVDSWTGLPLLAFRAVFGGPEDGQGVPLLLGGKACRAAAVKAQTVHTGEPLVAVGEETPFAWRNTGAAYQVELQGMSTQGLERLASFSAEIGDRVYTGCRWRQLEQPWGKAVFTAQNCEEQGE